MGGPKKFLLIPSLTHSLGEEDDLEDAFASFMGELEEEGVHGSVPEPKAADQQDAAVVAKGRAPKMSKD